MVELSIALPEGSTFQGRYRVVRCIKAGGMGAVYEVVHIETRRRRALKVMLPSLVADEDLRARFALEATVTAEVDSEHIVETFDAGVDARSGVPFLVMELLKGEDLQTALRRRGSLPAAEVVTLLRQAALALDQVHAVGVVHRDLKPDNLFLTTRDDGSPRLKVLDFGIAKVVAQGTRSGHVTRTLGTPVYMSPEQIAGDGALGPRSDLYALGHIAHTLLAGQAYWSPEARAADAVYPLMMKVMDGAREPATARAAAAGVWLPPAFDAWFAKATALSPLARFESAGEQVEALADAVGLARAPGRMNAPPADMGIGGIPTVLMARARPAPGALGRSPHPSPAGAPSTPIAPAASLLTTSAAVASGAPALLAAAPPAQGRSLLVGALVGGGVVACCGALWVGRASWLPAAAQAPAPSSAAAIPAPPAAPSPAEPSAATVVQSPDRSTPADRRRSPPPPPPSSSRSSAPRPPSSGGAAGSPTKPPPADARPAAPYDPSDMR